MSRAEAAGSDKKPLVVKTASVEVRQIDRTLSVTGSLLADESVILTPEVPGRVAQIFVDFGSPVKKGQILARLEAEEYRLQMERARAALSQALARLGLPPDATEKPDSTPALRQAKAALDDAAFKYESAQRLIKSGDISKDRYNEIEKAHAAAKAAYEMALYDMRMQLASVEALRADLKLAEKRLRDTALIAPFDGTVSERHASPGQYVRDTSPIVSLVKSWPLRLRVEIPESASTGVRVGSKLYFTAVGIEERFEAQVTQLNPSLDARSRTLTAEARLLKPDSRLKPGMFVQVNLVTESNARIVTVPRSAVYSVAGLSKVFAIENGQVREKRFVPGLSGNDWIEVPRDILAPGSSVALNHLADLVDGMTVVEERVSESRSSASTDAPRG